MARVIRSQSITWHPQAKCLGSDTADPVSDCRWNTAPGRDTLWLTKDHIKKNPTHTVRVTRETSDLYEMGK